MTATTVRRKSTFNPVSTFMEHLALKKEAATINTRSEALKKRLKEWIPGASEAYENENGSVFVDLPETVTVAGQEFKGMELRRSVPTVFNEKVAERILKSKGVYEKTLSTYVDQDKVYRIAQEGLISEKDIDQMFEDDEPRFAFWPIKGEVL